MSKSAAAGLWCVLLASLVHAAPAPPPPLLPASTPNLRIRTTAAVERRVAVDGRAQRTLVPADHVVAGDTVVYTLSVRNEGPDPATGVVVTSPIPPRMRYLPGSAVGPSAEISFSVDGGRSYGAPARLRVPGADGKPRRAVAADYTNVRWILQDELHAGSVAFLRYRAVLR